MNTAGQRRDRRDRRGSGSTLMAKTARRAVPHWTKLCRLEVTYAAADEEATTHRLMAAGLVGGMVLSSPSALAQPDVPPPPPAPVDPAAATVPPPAIRLPRRRRRIRCFPPGRRRRRLRPAAGSRRPPWPPPADGDSRGHARRPEPDAVHRGAAVRCRRRSIRRTAPRPEPPSRSTSTSSGPIADRQMAQDAVHISSVPPVPGRFYWTSDTQVRWRPQDFWPAGTVVNIDAAGTKSSFTVPEQLVATIDDATHADGDHAQREAGEDLPGVDGQADGHETKNGTYYVLEKFADIVMDSSTYGVPVNSAEGYKLKVQDAVRIDNSGIFVHSAPWSVGDRASATSATAASTSARPTRSGSTTTSAAAIPSSSRTPRASTTSPTARQTGRCSNCSQLAPDPDPPLRVQVQLVGRR